MSTTASDDTAARSPKKPHYTEDFERAWALYPRKKDVSKFDAYKAWCARTREGIPVEALIAGVERYAASCRAKGTEQDYIKHPRTFFGPGRWWEIEYDTAKPEPKAGGRVSPETELLSFYDNEPLV